MRRTLLLVVPALLLASCASRHATSPVAPLAAGISRPSSPANATLAVLESWQDAVAAQLDSLLTDDFQFVFAAADSAGNSYRQNAWGRLEELVSTYHVLVGGGPHPPVRAIHVAFDSVLATQPDPRPGRNPTWHKLIQTRVQVTLTENWDGTPSERLISGYAAFYLVRGDSAGIPPELAARGWKPDSTRWWLQRWDDDTPPPELSPPPAQQARRTSWGQLKVDYL